jgi:hypothetical protein
VQANVLAVEGPALLTPSAGGQSIPLTPGTHAGKGDIVEAPGASHTAIALLPNLLVQLDRNARLEIVRLAMTKDGNETGAAMQGRYADVRLLRGRMLASHVWGEALAKFTVVTPQGELVTTSNALFWIECDEQKTRITCVTGSIGFRAIGADEGTRIPPGFIGEWAGSGSSLVAAETDTQGQDDLHEGLEIEEKLRSLSSQKRLVLPR